MLNKIIKYFYSLYLTVKSTTDTFATGTRKAIPVNLPLSDGITLPTAFAAPVAAGIMFWAAPLPSLQSYKTRTYIYI